MNEIVKYDNYINNLKFKNFSSTDLDFLMFLCAKMKNKNTEEMTFDFSDIRQAIKHPVTSNDRFIKELKGMNEKMLSISCKLESEKETLSFMLFSTFNINKEDNVLTVAVNKKFAFILNELVKKFTRFELAEFIGLNSKYSKNLYRLLKQYRTTGKYVSNGVEEFKEILDSPKSYKAKEFKSFVLDVAIKELKDKKIFINLVCEPDRKKTRGRAVKGYIFTFDPEPKTPKTASSSVEPKGPLLTKDGFDLDFAWKETLKIYPRKPTNTRSTHKIWLSIVQSEEGKEKETCTAIFKAIQQHKVQHLTDNPDDEEFKYIASFKNFLEEWATK